MTCVRSPGPLSPFSARRLACARSLESAVASRVPPIVVANDRDTDLLTVEREGVAAPRGNEGKRETERGISVPLTDRATFHIFGLSLPPSEFALSPPSLRRAE